MERRVRPWCVLFLVVTFLIEPWWPHPNPSIAAASKPVESAARAPAVARSRRVRRLDVSATAYCLRGETSSGVRTRRGIVAADPRLLPEGTRLRIVGPASGYRGAYTVADRGPEIKGREIDIYMPSCRDAARFGRRQVQVLVLGNAN
jgi:3D (Asp-Asp-Asp) domain-containing protein